MQSRNRNKRSKRLNKNRRSRRRPNIPKMMVERKYFDTFWHTIGNSLPLFHLADYNTEIEGNVLGTNYGFVAINFPIQGTGPNQHIGSKYTITHINMRFVAYLHGDVDYVNSVRICLVLDKGPNGEAPDLIDIFRDLGSAGNTRFLSHLNTSRTQRFCLLYDKILDMDSDANSQQTVNVDINRKIPVQTLGSNGSISDISTGAIYLIAGSEVHFGVSLGSISASSYSTRITFLDF